MIKTSVRAFPVHSLLRLETTINYDTGSIISKYVRFNC